MSLANNNCIVCYPAWATILFLKDLTHGLFLSLSWISILVHNILTRWNFSSVYQLYFLHRGNASLANLCCNLIVSSTYRYVSEKRQRFAPLDNLVESVVSYVAKVVQEVWGIVFHGVASCFLRLPKLFHFTLTAVPQVLYIMDLLKESHNFHQ